VCIPAAQCICVFSRTQHEQIEIRPWTKDVVLEDYAKSGHVGSSFATFNMSKITNTFADNLRLTSHYTSATRHLNYRTVQMRTKAITNDNG